MTSNMYNCGIPGCGLCNNPSDVESYNEEPSAMATVRLTTHTATVREAAKARAERQLKEVERMTGGSITVEADTWAKTPVGLLYFTVASVGPGGATASGTVKLTEPELKKLQDAIYNTRVKLQQASIGIKNPSLSDAMAFVKL